LGEVNAILLPASMTSFGPVPLAGAALAPELTSRPTNRLSWKMCTPEMNGMRTSIKSGFVSETNVES
jgi:hypothetical protein